MFQGVQVGRCFFCRRPKVKRVLSGELKSMKRDVCGTWQRKAPWCVFLVLWCTAVQKKERTFWKKQGTFDEKSSAFFSFVSPCENGSKCAGEPLWAKVDNRWGELRKRSKNEARKRISGGGGGHAPKSLRQKNPRSHQKSGDGKFSLRFVGETAVVRLFDHLLRGAGKYQFS